MDEKAAGRGFLEMFDALGDEERIRYVEMLQDRSRRCARSKTFSALDKALAAMASLERAGRDAEAVRCPVCGLWHVETYD